MTLDEVIKNAIEPAYVLLPMKMASPEATALLLTIGLQESLFQFRRQMNQGPAKGFWQFEKGGSVKGVMTHPATVAHAQKLCAERNVRFDRDAVWNALEFDDVLAAGFARLNLWWVPGALPGVGTEDDDEAWRLYADVAWRPGKPHPQTWAENRRKARVVLGV